MNCWDLLGIEPTGDQDRIRQAYERQLKFASGDEAQALERAYREATGGAVERGWGSQIRSYVFYDNRVKDHRSNFEKPNPQNVLSGELDEFIDAELKRKRKLNG